MSFGRNPAMRLLAVLAIVLFGVVGLTAAGIATVAAVTGHYVLAVVFGFFAFMCALAIRGVVSPRVKHVRIVE